MKKILDTIGLPALLEQTAEECTELAQACLKYARFLRGENPTPKTEADCIRGVNDEFADVTVCMDGLETSGIIDDLVVRVAKAQKRARWKDRLEAMNK